MFSGFACCRVFSNRSGKRRLLVRRRSGRVMHGSQLWKLVIVFVCSSEHVSHEVRTSSAFVFFVVRFFFTLTGEGDSSFDSSSEEEGDTMDTDHGKDVDGTGEGASSDEGKSGDDDDQDEDEARNSVYGN